MFKTSMTTLTLVCVLASTKNQPLPHSASLAQAGAPVSVANPFSELEREAVRLDPTNPDDQWRLVQTAYDLKLHGSARRLARDLLKLDPQHKPARQYLGDRPLEENGRMAWLNPFEWEMRQRGLVRHARYGWVKQGDSTFADYGLLRNERGQLLPTGDLDAAHGSWQSRRPIRSRFFEIHSALPMDVQWFVADDLDRLVVAYAEFFELPHLPKRRFTVHLYRTLEDAQQAQAKVDLLRRYAAYYHKDTLHAIFDSMNDLCSLRHEAGHALNRHYMTKVPQWLDEGIGMLCDFLHVDAQSELEFGRLPHFRCGLKFLEEVQQGRKETLRAIAAAPHATTDSHYYSKFRAMVEFLLFAQEKRYRMPLLNAAFRNQGKLDDLWRIPGIEQEWQAYVRNLRPSPEWNYIVEPDRTEAIRLRLEGDHRRDGSS
jgi:hypothetical protein